MSNACESDFVRAYRYRDPRNGLFEVADNLYEVGCLVGGDYEMVFAHFSDGCVDRIADEDDIRRMKTIARMQAARRTRRLNADRLAGWLEL